MISNPRNKYTQIEPEVQSLNHSDEEIEVPISSTHYPSIMESRNPTNKRVSIILKICLAFLLIFLLLTVSLCFVYASKGHPGFYWLGVGLSVLAMISGAKLHWMQSMDWDNKVRYATVAQCAAVIFLCMGLMAVMYGPRLKETKACSAATEGFYVGGYITNLEYGGLLLGTSAVQVNAYATTFTLGTRFPEGATYTVSVIQQPYQNDPNKPSQYCRVSNPSGIISHANITSIAINCGNNKNQ